MYILISLLLNIQLTGRTILTVFQLLLFWVVRRDGEWCVFLPLLLQTSIICIVKLIQECDTITCSWELKEVKTCQNYSLICWLLYPKCDSKQGKNNKGAGILDFTFWISFWTSDYLFCTFDSWVNWITSHTRYSISEPFGGGKHFFHDVGQRICLSTSFNSCRGSNNFWVSFAPCRRLRLL